MEDYHFLILIAVIIVGIIILSSILIKPKSHYNYKCSFCDWELKNQKVRRTDPFCPKCGRNSDGKTKAQLINNSPADELLKFKKLRDENIITQEEFDAKKSVLLGK